MLTNAVRARHSQLDWKQNIKLSDINKRKRTEKLLDT